MFMHGLKNHLPIQDLLMLLVAISWGLTFLFTKLGLLSFSPLAVAAIRTSCAAILLNLFAFVHARKKGSPKFRLQDHIFAFLLGIIGLTVFPYCFSLAMQQTTSASGGIIFGATPVAVGAISCLLHIEKLDYKNWLGIITSFIGIIYMLSPQDISLGLSCSQGNLVMLAAMLIWAAYSVLNRYQPGHIPSIQITAYASLWGVTGINALCLQQLVQVNWQNVYLLAWAGAASAGVLGTGMAYLIWNMSIIKVGPARTAIYMNLVPIVACIAGFFFLGETLGIRHLLSSMLIITGVVLTKLGRRRKVKLHTMRYKAG